MSGPGDLDEGPSFSASSLISNPTPFDGGLLGAPFVFAKWGHGGLQCFLPADSSQLIPVAGSASFLSKLVFPFFHIKRSLKGHVITQNKASSSQSSLDLGVAL